MTTTCTCGRELREDDKFCAGCGQKRSPWGNMMTPKPACPCATMAAARDALQRGADVSEEAAVRIRAEARREAFDAAAEFWRDSKNDVCFWNWLVIRRKEARDACRPAPAEAKELPRTGYRPPREASAPQSGEVTTARIRARARREAFEEVWRKTFHMEDHGLSNWLKEQIDAYQPAPRGEPCSQCGGTGTSHAWPIQGCPACDGDGRSPQPSAPVLDPIPLTRAELLRQSADQSRFPNRQEEEVLRAATEDAGRAARFAVIDRVVTTRPGMAEVNRYVCVACERPIEPKGSEVTDGNGLTYHRGCRAKPQPSDPAGEVTTEATERWYNERKPWGWVAFNLSATRNAVEADIRANLARATAELRKQAEADNATIAELRSHLHQAQVSIRNSADRRELEVVRAELEGKDKTIAEVQRYLDEALDRANAAEGDMVKFELERDAVRAELAQERKENVQVKAKLERRTSLLEKWLAYHDRHQWGTTMKVASDTRVELTTDQPAETKS